MKNISLKIEDSIFGETEKILSKIKKPRNRYINEAIEYYNKLQNRLLSEILRVHIEKGTANLHQACDIMIDQVRAIDNKRLIKKTGNLPQELSETVKENLKIILDII